VLEVEATSPRRQWCVQDSEEEQRLREDCWVSVSNPSRSTVQRPYRSVPSGMKAKREAKKPIRSLTPLIIRL
jgi:hypothetical protein